MGSIDREGTVATAVVITVDTTNYTLDNAKVYMGETDVSSDWGLTTNAGSGTTTITFTIPAGKDLTGNIRIDVDTTRIGEVSKLQKPTIYIEEE